MIPKILLLIKQVRPATPQINNLRTSIPIFFQPRTLEAIKRIRDPFATAHHTFVLVVPKGTFVADSDQGRGAHVAVADGAFAVAFVAESAEGDTGLFTAHDEVAIGKGEGELACGCDGGGGEWVGRGTYG